MRICFTIQLSTGIHHYEVMDKSVDAAIADAKATYPDALFIYLTVEVPQHQLRLAGVS